MVLLCYHIYGYVSVMQSDHMKHKWGYCESNIVIILTLNTLVMYKPHLLHLLVRVVFCFVIFKI